MNSKLLKSLLAATATVAAISLFLTGCSTASNSGSGSDSKNCTAEGVNIVVMGGAPDDPFWSTVKNGALAAATSVEAACGEVNFVSMPNYDNFAPDAAKLVANMKAMKPSAVVIPNWVPEAQNENIKALSDAGIPVIIYNSGQGTVEEVGGKTYIGTDDYIAGTAGGKKMAQSGAKNIICVNTLPGTVNIDARCKGVADGATPEGATVTDLNLPSTQFGDPTAITQAIKSALIQDPSIDGVVTIGQADSDNAATAIEQASSSAKLGTFDVAGPGLERIKKGTQLFSIDQQPYAQGYYAVSYAFQLVAYAIELPISPLLTGPALITADNVDVVLKAVAAGTR